MAASARYRVRRAWCIERMSRGQADVVHCHLLFHLPVEYRAKRQLQVEAAIFRLVKRHGRGYWAEEVIDLRFHDNPDGKYLIKGGGPEGLEAVPTQEGASPLARHHLRQAVRQSRRTSVQLQGG